MKKLVAIALSVALLLCAGASLAEDYAIATDTAFRPFEYIDETGALVGIDIDLLAAIAEDQGFTYTIEALGWDASISACRSGEKDGMIAGASITESRRASGWIFSDGYFNATQSMAVAQGSDISNLEDLRGRSVAVKVGTLSRDYAKSLSQQFGFSLTIFESSPDVHQAVIDGVCAACFDDTPILADYIRSGSLPLRLVEGTANEGTEYGFAVFSAEHQDLVDKFNAGLANIRKNGVYDAILTKYLGQLPDAHPAS